jgi:hypothetical protein
MSNWNIKPKASNKKRAKNIKSAIKKTEKIKEALSCNGETARKKIEYNNEKQRKLMAQMFYR